MTSVCTGNILKKLRLSANLSAQEVSAILQAKYAIDLSPEILLDYEYGYCSISSTLFLALCKIYHCYDILYAFGYKQKRETPCFLSSEEQQIITNYRKLPLEEKNIILGALDIKKERFLRKIA